MARLILLPIIAGIIIASTYFPTQEEPLFGDALLLQSLNGKNAQERAEIKANFIKDLDLNISYYNATYNLDIEVVGISKIDGGIQILAKAWRDGQQLGFVDGTVEIERFNIYNPPILVPDNAGSIVKSDIDPLTGDTVDRRFRLDPLQAIKDALAHSINVSGTPSNTIVPGKVGNTTSTFYPDADPESASVDGWLRRGTAVNEAYSTIRSGAGTAAQPSIANATVNIEASATTNQWNTLDRTVVIFDTSSIPDTDTISAATLSIMGYSKVDNLSQTLNVTSYTASSLTNLVTGDFAVANHGSTKFATGVTVTAFSTSAYTDFTLNASGIANIDKDSLSTGDTLSKFSFRFESDIDNSAPTWVSTQQAFVGFRLAETTGSTEDPVLTVTHAAPAAESTSPPVININNGAVKINNGSFIIQ